MKKANEEAEKRADVAEKRADVAETRAAEGKGRGREEGGRGRDKGGRGRETGGIAEGPPETKSTDPPVHFLNPRPTHPPADFFFSAFWGIFPNPFR
jgi:hypothetical protein